MTYKTDKEHDANILRLSNIQQNANARLEGMLVYIDTLPEDKKEAALTKFVEGFVIMVANVDDLLREFRIVTVAAPETLQ